MTHINLFAKVAHLQQREADDLIAATLVYSVSVSGTQASNRTVEGPRNWSSSWHDRWRFCFQTGESLRCRSGDQQTFYGTQNLWNWPLWSARSSVLNLRQILPPMAEHLITLTGDLRFGRLWSFMRELCTSMRESCSEMLSCWAKASTCLKPKTRSWATSIDKALADPSMNKAQKHCSVLLKWNNGGEIEYPIENDKQYISYYSSKT